MILIRNARLIKELTEGYEGQKADVLIENGKIKKIAGCGSIEAGDGIEKIDINGNTLLPGLWDLHTHLNTTKPTTHLERITHDVGEAIFKSYDYALEYLRQGYTTVRDCGAAKGAVLYLRNAIDKGYLKGPRIIASGLIISPTEIGNNTFPGLYAEADSLGDLRRIAREELAKGADFLKYMCTGAFMNKNGNPGLRISTVEELEVIQEIADIKETYVAVHCHGAEAIKRCIEVGIRTIEHGSLIDDRAIEILQKSNKTFLIPTISVFHMNLQSKSDVGFREFIDNEKRELFHKGYECISNAYKAGLKMGIGSDNCMVDFAANPGIEFITRKKCCGFSDVDILLQATKYSAEIAGFGHELGSIKEGKIADLIVVDGKPDLDIEAMCKPAMHVFRNGEKLI